MALRRNTEEELQSIAWQWAGGWMKDCEEMPGCWEAWVEHEKSLSDDLTDAKVGREFSKFVALQQLVVAWKIENFANDPADVERRLSEILTAINK